MEFSSWLVLDMSWKAMKAKKLEGNFLIKIFILKDETDNFVAHVKAGTRVEELI